MPDHSSDLSDKGLIRTYIERKGDNRNAFCKKVGFSSSFLERSGGLTVANLRKIVLHPDFGDFNVTALLAQDSKNILKPKNQLSDKVKNHTFLVNAMQRVTEMQFSTKSANEEQVEELLQITEKLILELSELSEEHHHLHKEFNKLRKDFNIKG